MLDLRKNSEIYKLANYLFLLGIFFLPSSLFLGALFLLPAAIAANLLQKNNYFQDKWNLLFFISGCLMLFSSFLQKYFLFNRYSDIWDANLSFIGLANWIPFFWLFWTLQTFLNTDKKRKIFAYCLVSGTFPVLITGFAQYYLNWNGPFEVLDGLIIWYQKPIESPAGLSGLFSNQNYAGSWLNLVWPFCIALCLKKGQSFFKKSVSFLFLCSIGFSTFLTNSRNAWAGIIISLTLMLKSKKVTWKIPVLFLISLYFFYLIYPYLSIEIQLLIKQIIPKNILLEFSRESYEALDATRIEILTSATKYITQNPFFGTGAASFSKIYELDTTFWKGHSHNLIIELAISYGLPSAIILFITITSILVKSFKKIFLRVDFKNINYINKAFWASSFFFFFSQLFDIQYFDGKISIIAWTLLAGLKNIFQEQNETYKTYKK